jgi:hypothetical protein
MYALPGRARIPRPGMIIYGEIDSEAGNNYFQADKE